MSFALRPYQKDTIVGVFQALEKYNKVCTVAPTGAGKSTIGSAMCQRITNKGGRVLFVAHRNVLVEQFLQRAWSQFLLLGTRYNGKKMSATASVIGTMIQFANKKPPIEGITHIIVDECHHIEANTYQKLLEKYPHAKVIGLTATPFRGNGNGLDFDILLQSVKTLDLVKKEFLVGTRTFEGSTPDVDKFEIDKKKGDFQESYMAKEFNDTSIKEGVLDNYLLHAKGKKAICFNVNVAHSKAMCDLFNKAGIPSAHLDGTSDDAERKTVLKDFASGKILVLHNVELFTEGFDIPDTACVILNRATLSLGLYVQMVGRGLRPDTLSGKKHCIVLDHGGNTIRHGYVEYFDMLPFRVGKDYNIKEEKEKASKVKMVTCGCCGMVQEVSKENPKCANDNCDEILYVPTQRSNKVIQDVVDYNEITPITASLLRITGDILQSKKNKLLPFEIRAYSKFWKLGEEWAIDYLLKTSGLPNNTPNRKKALTSLKLLEIDFGKENINALCEELKIDCFY